MWAAEPHLRPATDGLWRDDVLLLFAGGLSPKRRSLGPGHTLVADIFTYQEIRAPHGVFSLVVALQSLV
jgi:hypothetical protein